MKKKDILFWGIIAFMIAFYLSFGNKAYEKKYEMVQSHKVTNE